MAMRKAKGKSSGFAYLARRLPADVAAVVQSKAMDLSGASLFCRRQAECAAVFKSIVQIKPAFFELKSPYKENFIASLHAYVRPNMGFSPEETVASALVRHADWYLRVRDFDALRERGTFKIEPQVLRPPMVWIEGIVKPTGEFTRDPEADGKPAKLFWRDEPGHPLSLAIEICGPGVVAQEPAFRRLLLQSVVDSLTVALGLKQPSAGRPRLANKAEMAAYYRDHKKAGRMQIAKMLCSCGGSQHNQHCFDRLNKLADSFYRTQRSAFEKLVREQTRKYPEINS